MLFLKLKNRVTCIRKEHRRPVAQLSPTRSEPRCGLEFICWRAHGRDGLSPSQVPHSRSGHQGGGQSPGAVLSVESIQQQQDGTDANDTSKDQRVTPLPEVDPLYQAVHGGKAVFGKPWLRSYLREASLMKSYRNHKQSSVQSINSQGRERNNLHPSWETLSTQSVDGAVRTMGRESVEKITTATRIHWISWAWV